MHGGTGGLLVEVTLNTTEVITAVSVRCGSGVDQLIFITNQRTLGPYGAYGGGAAVAPLPPSGSWLRYVSGSSSNILYNIIFWFA